MCVCVFSHIQFFATPWAVALQALLFLGNSQARILEQVAISYFRGSSQPRDRPTSCESPGLAVRFFTTNTTWEEYNDYCTNGKVLGFLLFFFLTVYAQLKGMKKLNESRNNTQLWMCLVVKLRSDAVKNNIA